MSQWVIYHNPRCSKSHQTLQLLRERGIDPAIVEYLRVGLHAEEVQTLLTKLGISAEMLLRKNEVIYRELALHDADDATIIHAIIEHPVLMQRPLVVHDEKAVLGRPPENIEALF